MKSEDTTPSWVWFGHEACQCGARATLLLRNAADNNTVGSYCESCASGTKWNPTLIGKLYRRPVECWPGVFAFDDPDEYASRDTIERALEVVWVDTETTIPGSMLDAFSANMDKMTELMKTTTFSELLKNFGDV